MNIFAKIKRKVCHVCFFCNNRGNLEKESKHIHVGWVYRRYHYKCLIDVLSNPENYTHTDVDMAIEIDSMRESRFKHLKKTEKYLAEENKERMRKIIAIQNRMEEEKPNGPINTAIL